jgi:putative nucleotidyltransferase with HDIG domain
MASKPLKQDSTDKSQVQKWDHLLEKLNDIPTLPVVATQVTELINDPNSSSSDIAAVLKKDQVLTAKVLKLVNSPYYGIPGEVTDVQRALAYLGFNTLAQLVLSISIISMFSSEKDSRFSLFEFWKHALATAVASEVLARKVNYAKPEECFTCGLLHDVGKVVLYQISPEDFAKVIKIAEQRKISFAEAEQAVEVPPHGYLGEYIANKWRLPMVIRLCIRYHHFDVSKMDTIVSNLKPAIQIVSLANQLVHLAQIGNSGNASGGQVTASLLEPFKLLPEELPAIIDQIKKDFDNVGAFLRQSA